MDGLDMGPTDKFNVKLMGEKMEAEMMKLSEKSLIDFLKVELKNPQIIFRSILKTIATNIFEEISSTGECSLEESLNLNFISLLSDQLRFNSLTSQERAKLHGFIALYASSLTPERRTDARKFIAQLGKIIRNNFFDHQRDQEIVKFLEDMRKNGVTIGNRLV